MPKGNRGGQRGATPPPPPMSPTPPQPPAPPSPPPAPKGDAEHGKITVGMDTVEFDGDLNYYGDDAAISASTRTATVAWENKRYKAKVEYAMSHDANGNPIGAEVRGGKGSVRTPVYYHDRPRAVFTHNHPRVDGVLGGTFSHADLKNFANYRNTTTRATAKEGTYSISKTVNFDAKGFLAWDNNMRTQTQAAYHQAINNIQKDISIGKIKGAKQITDAYNRAANNWLIAMHNELKANESKYGYTYTLERRTK